MYQKLIKKKNNIVFFFERIFKKETKSSMKYNNELLKCTYIINLNLISRGIPYNLH